jgi:uncharacterized protein YdaU (DUF1376 family)
MRVRKISLFRAGLSDRFLPHKGTDLPEFPPDRPAPKEIDLHYFKRNIGDYHKKAGRLSMVEHGAYTLLMDACYDREQFPTLEQAYDWCWARTEEEKAAVRFVLEKFFVCQDGIYSQSRIQEEIARFHENSSTNARIAREREEKRRTERERSVNGNDTNRHLTNNHKPLTTNQEPVSIEEPKGSLSEAGLPPCPHQKVIDLFHELLPELPKVIVWNKTREGLLRARWKEAAAEKKWKSQEEGIEHFREFFGFVRKSKFLMGKTAVNGRRPFECELEWLIRPNNWVKVIEGKYHGS